MLNKMLNHQQPSEDEEIVPSSLIDMVFLLLIFFFLTAAAAVTYSGGEPSEVSREEIGGGEQKMDLPLGFTNVDATIDIEDVRILIDRVDDTDRFEWFILGREPKLGSSDTFNRDNREDTKSWDADLRLDQENPDHQEFLRQYGQYLESSDNPLCRDCYKVDRYGLAPANRTQQRKPAAQIALFLEYFLRLDEGAGPDQLDVEIMADSGVKIGFINEIMNICGTDSIPKISFILKQKKQETG